MSDLLERLLVEKYHNGVEKSIIKGENVFAENQNSSILSNVAKDGDTISLMRLFHYFPGSYNNTSNQGSQNQAVLGSSPHTDWGYLTLILQDDIGGLQFLQEDNNQWIDVPAIPGTLVVNGGDFLQLLSKGRYKSPIHRVLCPSEDQGERYSFVYFYYPGYDTEFDQNQAYTMDINVDVNGNAGTHNNNGERGEYNTLLASPSPGSVSERKFGAYIRKKWREVFRK